MVTHPYKFNDHSGWVGISHCCIFKNPDTKEWFYCSQGRLPGNTNGNAYSNAIMMGHIKKIRWTNDGWPVVMPERYSAVPDRIIKESELIGTWEVIKADYKYGVQQTSVRLELKENGKSTGAFTGIWSYENSLKQLKIGNFTFYVERELDWENDPRCETIVFSGLSNTGKPYWAKKIE